MSDVDRQVSPLVDADDPLRSRDRRAVGRLVVFQTKLRSERQTCRAESKISMQWPVRTWTAECYGVDGYKHFQYPHLRH